MGSPLALEVGEECQALRARGPALRLFRQLVEGRLRGENVAKPAQGAGRVQHHAHRLPGAGDGVAEGVDSRLGVVGVRGQRGQHDTRGAEHDRDDARLDDADAERGRLLVAGSGDLGGFVDRREPVARNVERGQHVVAPAPVLDVEEQRARGVRGVEHPLARQPETDVVLRQHDTADPAVDVGLVAAQPEQLRGREARKRPVAGERDQPLEADALLDLGALGPGALVVPEDRGPQDAVVLVEADETVHLAGEADSGGSTPRRASALSLARSQSSGSCSDQPGCGVESGYVSSADETTSPSGVIAIALTPVVPTSRPTSAVTRRRAPRTRARTPAPRPYACCASRRAASSILAATESMNRQCRTLRFTAATASSVYGYRSNPSRSPFSP